MKGRREFLKGVAGGSTLAALASIGEGGCTSLSAPAKPPKPVASWRDSLLLRNLTIVDVENGVLNPSRNILIRNGRIEALPADGEVQGGAADVDMDLGGRYVIPGLINAHCHITLPCGLGSSPSFLLCLERQMERNAEECIRHGVTTVRDMGGVAGWVSDLQAKIQGGEIIGPRILRSTIIQVPGGYSASLLRWIDGERTIRIVESEDECRKAVREAVDSGTRLIKIFLQYRNLLLPAEPMPLLTDGMISAIEEEAEKCGIAVACHNTYLDGHRRTAKARIRSFEHIARDERFSDEDVKIFTGNGYSFVPTGSVAWALVFEMKGDPNWSSEKVQLLVSDRSRRLPELLKEFVEEPIMKGCLDTVKELSNPAYFEKWHLLPTPDPRFFTDAAIIGSENIMKLYDAGAFMGCGNDGGVPFIFPGAMTHEMHILERLGIDTKDILKAATVNNAQILRMEKELGNIDKGKRADLVVLDKNPLESVENLSSAAFVFKDGALLHTRQA